VNWEKWPFPFLYIFQEALIGHISKCIRVFSYTQSILAFNSSCVFPKTQMLNSLKVHKFCNTSSSKSKFLVIRYIHNLMLASINMVKCAWRHEPWAGSKFYIGLFKKKVLYWKTMKVGSCSKQGRMQQGGWWGSSPPPPPTGLPFNFLWIFAIMNEVF
jgi:hypothetical protein